MKRSSPESNSLASPSHSLFPQVLKDLKILLYSLLHLEQKKCLSIFPVLAFPNLDQFFFFIKSKSAATVISRFYDKTSLLQNGSVKSHHRTEGRGITALKETVCVKGQDG